MPKPIQLLDNTNGATMNRAAASKAIADAVRANQKPGPSASADAAIAERAATVDLAKRMQAAPSPSAAAQIKREADDARLKYSAPTKSTSPPTASDDDDSPAARRARMTEGICRAQGYLMGGGPPPVEAPTLRWRGEH